MQALDLIDVEGCVIVMERLIALTGSSAEAVERLERSLLQPFALNLPAFASLVMKVRTGRESRQGDFDIGRNEEESTTRFPACLLNLLRLQTDLSMSGQELEEKYQAALGWAASLSAEDCLLVLRLWLISLTAKDMSLVIVMRSLWGELEYGRDIVAFGEEVMEYKLRLVDVACKPAIKTISKLKKEAEMCSIVSQFLGMY